MQLNPLDQCIGKTIVIVGLGLEGQSTFRFIRAHLPENKIILSDDKPIEELDSFWQQALEHSLVSFMSLSSSLDPRDAQTSVLFKTPGLPVSHSFVKALLEQGSILLSNTQLFFELVNAYNAQHGQPTLHTIGITGTKGKSTTTSMIHHVLNSAGLTSYLGGNIGKPALDIWEEWAVNQPTPAYFVLELSAHQLAKLSYSPHIAVVQDITPEHLDYYKTFDTYVFAKSAITKYQHKNDIVVFNGDSVTAQELADMSPGQWYSFTLRHTGNSGHITNDQLTFEKTPIMPVSDVPLVGAHNLYNVFPALIISQLLGIAPNKAAEAIRSFRALPHRLEKVAELRGVIYVDDSIATTPEATVAAIRAMSKTGTDNTTGKLVLIAGGYDRQQNYTNLAREIIDSNIETIILFPPTGTRLKEHLKILQTTMKDDGYQLQHIFEVETMKEAVDLAHRHAEPGDTVLLSPAAASFGRFIDYRDRGNQFKQEVERITDTPSSV